MNSQATPASADRKADPSGVMSPSRSTGHSSASRSGACSPVTRTSARPWVRSITLTNSSGADPAAVSVSRPATAAAAPGGASTSHSPGPDPATSQPASRLARPNGTPSALAIAPFHGARTCTLASGVQSVIVRAASLRQPLTSQPASTMTGAAGAIGLRASTGSSDTHPAPLGIDVGEVLADPGGDQPTAGKPHRDLRAGLGQPRLDLGQADRAAEGGRHPAGGDPAYDVVALDDLGCLRRYHRAVAGLQPDQAQPAAVRVLPGELRLADEVRLVELDRPVQAGAEAAGQAVGVLPDDEVALFQPQDALRLHPERTRAKVGAALHERFPDVQPVCGWDMQLVAELPGEA